MFGDATMRFFLAETERGRRGAGSAPGRARPFAAAFGWGLRIIRRDREFEGAMLAAIASRLVGDQMWKPPSPTARQSLQIADQCSRRCLVVSVSRDPRVQNGVRLGREDAGACQRSNVAASPR